MIWIMTELPNIEANMIKKYTAAKLASIPDSRVESVVLVAFPNEGKWRKYVSHFPKFNIADVRVVG